MKRKLLPMVAIVIGIVMLVVFALWFIGGFTATSQASISISAPPEKVFPFLTEIEKLKQWLDGVTEITPLSGDGFRVGAKSRVVVEKNGKRLEMEDEVTQLETNRLLELHMVCSMFDMTNRYEITENGGETQLRQTVNTNYNGFVRVFVPFMGKVVDKKLAEDLQRLKGAVEGK